MLPLPGSDNPWIADFLDGLKRRSRALKHKTRSVECERVFEEADGVRSERIDLFFDRDLFRERLVLHTMIWDGRWVWINVRGTAEEGSWIDWAFEGRAAGSVTGRSLMASIEEAYDAIQLARFADGFNKEAFDRMWDKILLKGPRAL